VTQPNSTINDDTYDNKGTQSIVNHHGRWNGRRRRWCCDGGRRKIRGWCHGDVVDTMMQRGIKLRIPLCYLL